MSDQPDPEEATGENANEKASSPLAFTGLMLWGISPAILVSTCWMAPNPVADIQLMIGVFGTPIILYFWSQYVIKRNGSGRFAAIFGLTVLMCFVNVILCVAGCSALYLGLNAFAG